MDNSYLFKDWIKNFENVDLPIGDLAKDIARSKDFPASNDYNALYGYVRVKAKYDRVILEVFETVWNFFVASAF